MDPIEARFAICEDTSGGYPVRVFAENYSHLSQIYSALDDFADREFIVHADRRFTYAECRQQAAKLSAHLANELHVQPGERVGLALANSPQWMLAFIAITALGAVPALINARGGQEEINHCLRSTGCRVCLLERDDLEVEVALSSQQLAAILAGALCPPLPDTPRLPDDEALLMFTSGTTGLPKAASLSHRGLLTALKTIQYSSALIAKQMAQTYGIDYETLVSMRPPPVNLLIFPLFHVSGCHAIFLTSLLQGGKVVLLSRWDVGAALAMIEEEKVTAFAAVPTMYRDILRFADRDQFDLSSLTNISVGGQATPPALLSEIVEAFPNVVMGTGYGMTEANGTVTLSVGADFVAHSSAVGRVVSTWDVEIRNPQGKPLDNHQHGEIYIRGAALMSRYANVDGSPFATDGWFATGDIGYFDDDDLLYVIDRKTDMVISAGENIYCAEVERVLDLHPEVRESAAFGQADERLGERLVAAVSPHPGHAVAEDTLLEHCAAHLAKHKVPKALYIRSEPLPRNASGKLVKRTIKEHYQ